MNSKQYLLTCFMEEAIEVAHAASKVLRFTEVDKHPLKEHSNIEELQKEWSELMALKELLQGHDIHLEENEEVKSQKKARFEQYLNYSKHIHVVIEENNDNSA